MPLSAGLWFGRKVLKLDPLVLLGPWPARKPSPPDLAAVQEKSQSPVAVIGYSASYPVAQIVMTAWGTVIVLLMS